MINYIRKLLAIIGTFLSGIVNIIFQSFTHYDAIVSDINQIVGSYKAAKANLEVTVQTIKQFNVAPKWKSRVINVPIAVEQLKNLYSDTADTVVAFIDSVVDPVHQLTLILQTESVPDIGDPQHAVNAMSKATVKLGEVATMIHQIATAFNNVNTLVTTANGLLSNLQGLDSLFLQQGNPKILTDVNYRKRQSS